MLDVVVTAKQQEAYGVVSIELRLAGGGTLPSFEAGAHIDVVLPNGVTRQYSLCNKTSERNRYMIGVLRETESRGGSSYLHDSAYIGDTLKISEPRNLFALSNEGQRSLLFAGGIGITPILCMAEDLSAAGRDFKLHYCGRSRARLAFLHRMAEASFGTSVQVHCDDGPVDQRLNAVAAIGAPDAGTHLYVCGPKGFMDYILDTAANLGWPEKHLHREYFSAGGAVHGPDDAFEVELKSSGRVITVGANESVIDALLAAGIDVPVACAQGVCGTCITHVVSGEPDHRDVCLSDEDKSANMLFTPCCSRALSKRLVLDI
jgi:vanillate O-demethylase ferredoxin subunit